MSGFEKNETEKEFMCRACSKFLDPEELIDGKCPFCDNDESVFINDLNNE